VLSQYESELLEKEHSGCAALLNDDKVGRVARPACRRSTLLLLCHASAGYNLVAVRTMATVR